MRILTILLILSFANIQTIAQQSPDQPRRPQSQVLRPKAKEKRPLSDIEKMDNLVRMVAAGHAVHGALDYFIDFFDKRATTIRDQAEAAYRHRLERKVDKKYRIEIEYSYYKAMSKTMDEMKAPQAVIDSVATQVEVPRRKLAAARTEWRSLATRLVSLQKRSPLRHRGATAPKTSSRTPTNTNGRVVSK